MSEAYTTDADVLPFTAGAGSALGRLEKARVQAGEDVSGHLTEAQLAEIGGNVVRDWDMDRESNADWRTRAEEALAAAAQEPPEPKAYPWKDAANVQYPLLTIAAIQFAARAYPAIVKGDEAIKIKTFGKDAKGLKGKRAKRMAEYLNYKLFYGVDDWEGDTDAMLLRLPITGQHFRKVWWDPMEGRCCIESVSALRLTIPANARSLKSSPRITHDFDRYPYELQGLIKAGQYRDVKFDAEKDGDDQAARLILEQHRMMDLDDDGLEEPYIVTVDHATEQVLRIEEAFDEEGVKYVKGDDGQSTDIIAQIDRWCPFVAYPFIPDPKGRAYAIGFGHLLSEIMAVINTNINLMIDAGHAQVAGGGFIASEVRLQGAGQNLGAIYWEPGEYKTVSATGMELRAGIYERNFPAPSPVIFQLLGMLMEAAKDIASVNDAITGDAARTAPVGTTLALIEQGQQVFNAIYKRIYRALREEFRLFVDCLRKYGDPAEYARFVDEEEAPMMGHNGGPAMDGQEAPSAPPQGLAGMMGGQPAQPGMVAPQQAPPPPVPVDPAKLFEEDFNADDLDIRPVSDPSVVTKQQQLARDQFTLQFLGKGIYADDRAVVRQVLTDIGVDQAEEWIPENPAPPNPVQLQMMALEAGLKEAQTQLAAARAQLATAQAAEIANEATGAQADVNLAHKSADTLLKNVKAADMAAKVGAPDPIDGGPMPGLEPTQ